MMLPRYFSFSFQPTGCRQVAHSTGCCSLLALVRQQFVILFYVWDHLFVFAQLIEVLIVAVMFFELF